MEANRIHRRWAPMKTISLGSNFYDFLVIATRCASVAALIAQSSPSKLQSHAHVSYSLEIGHATALHMFPWFERCDTPNWFWYPIVENEIT